MRLRRRAEDRGSGGTGGPRRRAAPWACAVAAVALSGCAGVTLDMRALRQPVLLNSNPVAGGTAETFASSDVDTWVAKVGHSAVAAGGGNSSSSSSTVTNTAQVAAFKKIGGDPTLAITDVAVTSGFFAINWGFALALSVDIDVTGKVRKFSVSGSPAQGGSQ